MTDLNLKNLSILNTRPAKQAEKLNRAITKAQGQVYCLPTLEIQALVTTENTKNLQNIAAYDWLIFISQNAVDFAMPIIREKIKRNTQIAAVGKATAALLKEYGFNTVIYPQSRFSSEHLLALPELHAVAQQKIAIICGEDPKPTLKKILVERGAQVDELCVYRRSLPKLENTAVMAAFKENAIDAIVCTSKHGLMNLKQLLNEIWPKIQATPLVVVSEAMLKLGMDYQIKKIIVAENADDEAILQALMNKREIFNERK